MILTPLDVPCALSPKFIYMYSDEHLSTFTNLYYQYYQLLLIIIIVINHYFYTYMYMY